MRIQQPSALLWRQPVPETDTQPPHAFDAADAGREFRAQQPGIRRLVRDTADGCEPKVDRRRCVLPLFEVDPITENHCAVECEARLRAVPGDELTNRVIVGSLAAGGGQAVEYRRFGLFQVGKREDSLGCFFFCDFGLALATASFTVAVSLADPLSLRRL